jgi:hypothetical protein
VIVAARGCVRLCLNAILLRLCVMAAVLDGLCKAAGCLNGGCSLMEFQGLGCGSRLRAVFDGLCLMEFQG